MEKDKEKQPKIPQITDGTSRTNREGGRANREAVDFYIENGLYVFTEKFLRERGHCCQSRN